MELNTPEIHRLALIVGSFTAIHYKDRWGVIPGGIIVPGFLVILLTLSPLWCFAVLASAYAIHAIFEKYLNRVEYQRRTPMYILTVLSILLTYPVALLYMQAGILPTSLDSLSGTMLPAVIAFTFFRQGVERVSRGMAIATAITAAITALLLLAGRLLINCDFNYLNQYYQPGESLHFNARVVQFLVCLLIGYLIYKRTQMRAGGYMVAPVAAAMLLQPLSAIVFLMGCFFVYFNIKIMSTYSLIIGLRRYVIGLLYSIVFVWGVELAFIAMGSKQLPFQGNHLFVIIAIMSYANDCILHEERKVIPWMLVSIAAMIVCLVLTGSVPI
jgi:hypothetical protein